MDLIANLRQSPELSALEALRAGDYLSPALNGRADQWPHHAARGMIADPLAGTRALAAFDEPEASFYRAVCAWIGGDEDLAARLLEPLADPHARNLLALIRRPRIDVLTQLPSFRGGPFVLLDGIDADSKFRVRNIGIARSDVRLSSPGRAAPLCDPAKPPDFFLCAMVEGQDVPADVGDLPCPTIGCTSDFDIEIPVTAPWLRAFDHIITCDNVVQWAAVREITGHPTHAYPLLFGTPRTLPPLGDEARDIDIFMSGQLFAAYQPDKAEFVHQLLRIPNTASVLMDGTVDLDTYYRLLARAKITPCFCRFPGAMLTRAIEAMGMGSIAVVPEGSVHLLWGGEEQGIFTYDPVVGPAPQIARILAGYSQYGSQCLDNAARLREALAAKTVASRLFRFCTVLAAQPCASRDSARSDFLVSKRPSFLKSAGIDTDEGTERRHRTLQRLAKFDRTAPAARWHNDAAREFILAYGLAAHQNRMTTRTVALLGRGLDILEDAVVAYPRHLILHFQLMRTLYCFGGTGQRARGVALAREIVSHQPDKWQVDPLDDLYPPDFNGGFVNTRAFYDLAVLHLAGKGDQRPGMRDIVLASAFHLLAVREGDVNLARRAADLDPEFPFYQLTLAELLAEPPSLHDINMIREILDRLAAGSVLAGGAHAMLDRLVEREVIPPRSAGSTAAWARAGRGLLLMDQHKERFSSSFYAMTRLRRNLARDSLVYEAPSRPQHPRLSAVLCGRFGVGCAEPLADLANQSLSREIYEIVYVDCYGNLSPEAGSSADVVLNCRQDSFLDFRLAALNEALQKAAGEVVAIFEPGRRVDRSALAAIDAVFYPERTIAHRAGAASRVVIGECSQKDSPPVIAFRASDAATLGGFDQHYFFAGGNGLAYELAWRLARSGIPVFGLSGKSNENPLWPWWKTRSLESGRLLVETASVIAPTLFDETRRAPLLGWRPLPSRPAIDERRPDAHVPTSLTAKIGAASEPRGFRLALAQLVTSVVLAIETSRAQFAEDKRPAAALAAGLAVLVKPSLVRLVPYSLYLRLATFYRRRLRRG